MKTLMITLRRILCPVDFSDFSKHAFDLAMVIARWYEESTDLIVLGVQSRGPLDRMLFGSTTQDVVRKAPCPVLTVRP